MKCEYCGREFDSRKGMASHRQFNSDCRAAWVNDQNRLREHKLSSGHVVCAICGDRLKTITNTHLARHGLTMADYKNIYKESLFAQDVLDIQRDRREISLRTRYTNEERRQFCARGMDTKIEKYGSLDAYHKWLRSTYADVYEKVNASGALRFKHQWEKMTEEEKKQEVFNRLEKRKKTNLKKYGVEFAQTLQATKDKTKKTKLDRYGDENYSNKEQILKTLFKNYGRYSNFFPRFSLESQELFNIIEPRGPFPCFFATNGLKDKSNEYQVRFYGSDHTRFLDFYFPLNKKWIEFDEEHHKRRISEDTKRENEIFGCLSGVSLLRVSKEDYLNNADETVRDCLDYLYCRQGWRTGFRTMSNMNLINTRMLAKVKLRI